MAIEIETPLPAPGITNQTPDKHEPSKPQLTTAGYVQINRQYCAPTHAPIPIVMREGKGAYMWDIDGKEYIDFLSAFFVANQGHSHPRIVNAMIAQCQKLALCTSAYQNETYPLLCKKLCQLLGYDLVSAMSSGSEATDLAFKIARKWGYNVKKIAPNQAKILTLAGGYHGKTLAPLSSSSFDYIKSGFGPFLPNIGPDVAGFSARFNEIDDIKRAFETSGDTIAAVVTECVQGFAGCQPAEKAYLKGVSELCREYNVLFISDEIQTGFGRTGALMAYQHYDIKPDMVVIGKSLTGGLYPMSLVLGSQTVMTQIRPGEHSSTFAANPLASAIALEAVDVVLEERLPERANRLGQQLKDRLSSIKSPHGEVKVTGLGFLLSLHLDESHPSGRVTAARLGELARRRGLAVMSAENRIRIAPSLVIDEETLWKGVDILEKALSDLGSIEEI